MSHPTVEDWPEALTTILHESTTCSLATVDDQGEPHAANLNFAFDKKIDLYFLSAPHSRHIQHILKNPKVAVTAYTPFTRASQICGLQIHAMAEMVNPKKKSFGQLWKLLTDRFPDITAMEERAKNERFYRIRPTWIRWIDNRKGFGWKAETAWPPSTL